MKAKTESEQVRKWEGETRRLLPLSLSHFPTFPLSKRRPA